MKLARKVLDDRAAEPSIVGFRSWLKRATSPKPRRPWVRPEFLGATLIVGALVGMAFFGTDSGTEAPQAPQQRSEYVGLDPASLPLVDCNPGCQADDLLAAWKAAHPDATIVELQPHYQGAHVVGYTVVYQE